MRATRRPVSRDGPLSPLNRLLAIGLLVLVAGPASALENDFSFYPAAARECLERAAARAACKGADVGELNGCLCGNGSGFVTEAARCLGERDRGDVMTVYRTMSRACGESATPLGVSMGDFLDLAAGGEKSSSSSSTTTTTTTSEAPTETTRSAQKPTSTTTKSETLTSHSSSSTASPASASESPVDGAGHGAHRLSKGAIVGIATGVSVGGVAAVALIAFLLFHHRRRRGEADATLASGPAKTHAAAAGAEYKPVWSPYEWPAPQHPVYEMDGASTPQPTQPAQPSELPGPK